MPDRQSVHLHDIWEDPPHTTTRRGRSRVRAAAFVVVAVLGFTLVACGDDDASPEQAFCDAGDSLEQSIDSLASLDVVAEGTDSVKETLGEVKSDLGDLKSAGGEVASDEINALEEAVDSASSAVDSVGSDGITVDSASAVVAAITTVATSADAVYTTLGETCA